MDVESLNLDITETAGGERAIQVPIMMARLKRPTLNCLTAELPTLILPVRLAYHALEKECSQESI